MIENKRKKLRTGYIAFNWTKPISKDSHAVRENIQFPYGVATGNAKSSSYWAISNLFRPSGI